MSTDPTKYGFDPVALSPTPASGPAPTPAVPVPPPLPKTLLLPPPPAKDKPAATTPPVPAPTAEPPKSPTPPPVPGRADWVAEVFKLMATPTRQKGVIAAGLLSLAGGAGAAKYFWPKQPVNITPAPEVAAANPAPAPLPAPPITPAVVPPGNPVPPVLPVEVPNFPPLGVPNVKVERTDAPNALDLPTINIDLPIPAPAPPAIHDPNLLRVGDVKLPDVPAPTTAPAPPTAPPSVDLKLPPPIGAAAPPVPKPVDIAPPSLVTNTPPVPAPTTTPAPELAPPKLGDLPLPIPLAPPATKPTDLPLLPLPNGPAMTAPVTVPKTNEPPQAKPIVDLPKLELPDIASKSAPAAAATAAPGLNNPATGMPVLPPVNPNPPVKSAADPLPAIKIDQIPPRPAASAPPLTLAPVKPVETAPAGDVQTDFDVDLHDVRAGETYAAVSKLHFGDDRYADAIRAFNRGVSPDQVRQLQIPPVHVLRKQSAQLAGRSSADTGIKPAEWTTAPAGRTETARGGKTYDVPPGGITLKGIAKLAYGDESQWVKLWDLNPKMKPDETLPEGTRVTVPADAKLGR